MAQTPGGTYYAASSELVSSWPATSLDLANQLESRFAAKANLASPALTGTPTAPTAASGTNTTQIATTAFVQAAGGLVLLTQQTMSAQTSLSINSVFSTTYDTYRVQIDGHGAGNAQIIYMRMRTGGSDVTSGYYAGGAYVDPTSTSTTIYRTTGGAGGANSYMDLGYVPNGSTARACISLDLFGPFLSDKTTYVGNTQGINSGSWYNMGFIGGMLQNTTSYDSVTIHSNANFTGTVRIFGYRKS